MAQRVVRMVYNIWDESFISRIEDGTDNSVVEIIHPHHPDNKSLCPLDFEEMYSPKVLGQIKDAQGKALVRRLPCKEWLDGKKLKNARLTVIGQGQNKV